MNDAVFQPPAKLLEQMDASRADIRAGRIVKSDAVVARGFAAIERIKSRESRQAETRHPQEA